MNINRIVVTAGRTFNHPHEQYSNLRPSVVLEATLIEGEDPVAAARELQRKAEGIVEDHKQSLLRSIEELHAMTQLQEEVRGLEQTLGRAQDRLKGIRQEHPQLALNDGGKGE